jgi:hypothetical protein
MASILNLKPAPNNGSASFPGTILLPNKWSWIGFVGVRAHGCMMVFSFGYCIVPLKLDFCHITVSEQKCC